MPAPLNAQTAGADGILGMWYAASRVTEDGRTVPVDYGTQWDFWIYEDRGQFLISNGYAWSSLPIVRRSESTFETAQGQRYTLRLVSPDKMTFEGNGRSLRFDRQSRDLTAPVPAESSDSITFKQPWATRQWFEGVRKRFQAEHGRSLEACFSDRTCLAACPVNAAACDNLRTVIETYVEGDQERDPLFVDRSAAYQSDQELLSRREQLLRFRDGLDNAKVRSLAAARAATRTFFLWLAVDTGSDVVIDDVSDDERDRTVEMIEVVGCTVAGYLPVLGDAVATNCALKSATGIATSGASLATSNLQGISLNRVMQGLIDAEACYHDIAYDKYHGLFDHALRDEEILSGIVKTIRDGRLAIPRALSDDEMKAAMWAAVWPYALHGYGVGPTAVTEIDNRAQDAACEVRPQDGEFAVTVHEHLDKGAARNGTRLVNQYAVFRWSLRTGTIENSRPLEPRHCKAWRATSATSSRVASGSSRSSGRPSVSLSKAAMSCSINGSGGRRGNWRTCCGSPRPQVSFLTTTRCGPLAWRLSGNRCIRKPANALSAGRHARSSRPSDPGSAQSSQTRGIQSWTQVADGYDLLDQE
jgi:hypothetical protein